MNGILDFTTKAERRTRTGLSQETKGIIMKRFIGLINITGAILMMATATLPTSFAFAADSGEKKGSADLSAKPADKTKATPVKGEAPDVKKSAKTEKAEVHKRGKVVRLKPAAYQTREKEAEPGERLTIKQVMELLKTTRNLSGKNLCGLRLIGLDLSKCNFKGADLSNANLERADLGEAILERANLSGANMKMTDLRVTGLKGARLERAVLDGAIWQDGTICAKGSIGSCRENPDRFGPN